MGEERLATLVRESLAVAVKTGAARPVDFTRVIVDTTVQEKAIAFPTDARLMHTARERLVRLAKKAGVDLRQSYTRVGKHALIAHQRYAHAEQFNRANRAFRAIRTMLGRVIRDVGRRIRGEAELEAAFALSLSLARQVHAQDRRQRGQKIYSLHAPETECIGKRQGSQALRVRLQGQRRHPAEPLQGRPVRRPCEGGAGSPLRRPHACDHHPRDRGQHRRAAAAPDLRALRRELDSMIDQCRCGTVADCRIIEALSPAATVAP